MKKEKDFYCPTTEDIIKGDLDMKFREPNDDEIGCYHSIGRYCCLSDIQCLGASMCSDYEEDKS